MKKLVLLVATLALTVSVNAENISKANNSDPLNQGSSWVGGNAPGTADRATFDNTLTAANNDLTFSGDWAVQWLYFTNNLNTNVTISGAGWMNLYSYLPGSYTLDSSQTARNVTINANVRLMSDSAVTSHVLTVGAGGTMTINGNIERGVNGVNFYKKGGGTLVLTGSMAPMNVFAPQAGTTIISGTYLHNAGLTIDGMTAADNVVLTVSGNGKFGVNGDFRVGNNGTEAAPKVMTMNLEGNAELNVSRLGVGAQSGSYQQVIFNQNGGVVNTSTAASNARELLLAQSTPGAGYSAVYNLNGGVINIDRAWIGNSGTLNLNGGVIKFISGGLGNVTLFRKDGNLGGGHVIVSEGGAIIDTNGKNSFSDANNELPIEHNAALGATKDGGLTVRGGGTLFLNKVNTYTGDTTIEANTLLDIGANGKLGDGNIFVEDYGKLWLRGSGNIDPDAYLSFGSNTTITLDYNGTLTLAGLYNATTGAWLAADQYSAADLTAYGFVLNGGKNGSLTVLGTIPEPSAWLLLLSGSGLLLVLRQRRK